MIEKGPELTEYERLAMRVYEKLIFCSPAEVGVTSFAEASERAFEVADTFWAELEKRREAARVSVPTLSE